MRNPLRRRESQVDLEQQAIDTLRGLTGDSYNHDLVMKIRRAIKRHIVGWSESHTQAEVVGTLRAVATSEET